MTSRNSQYDQALNKINKFYEDVNIKKDEFNNEKFILSKEIKKVKKNLNNEYNKIKNIELPLDTLSKDFKKFKNQRNFKRNLINCLIDQIQEKNKKVVLQRFKEIKEND